MPSWGIHLEIAKQVANKMIDINQNLFMLGNIIPDINNGYVIQDISQKIPHSITHYRGKEGIKNYDFFTLQYKEYLQNEVVLGYVTHLLTDYYYNYETYDKKGIHDKNGKLIGIHLHSGEERIATFETIRKMKTNDFKIFAKFIYEKEDFATLKYDKDILKVNDIIKEIKITKEDVLKTIDYLNGFIQRERCIIIDNKQEYKIFTQQEMLQKLERCVDFIIRYLKQVRKDIIWKS